MKKIDASFDEMLANTSAVVRQKWKWSSLCQIEYMN